MDPTWNKYMISESDTDQELAQAINEEVYEHMHYI
jgi:hypothetical protein